MDKAEYLFFLTGGIGLENKHKNPGQGWLSDKSWDELCRLSDLSNFIGLRLDKISLKKKEPIKYVDFLLVKVLYQILKYLNQFMMQKIQ
jgi:hypothetical protein